jgi:hypothetical protein
MSDKLPLQSPFHLGMPGINSPGYAPRAGTKAKSEADAWMREYWDKMFKNRKTINGVSVRADV